MDLNAIRNVVIDKTTDGNLLPLDAEAARTLALIYLGDAIREGTSDIGPALQGGLGDVATELDSLSRRFTR